MECFPPIGSENIQMYAKCDVKSTNLRKRSVQSRSGKEKRCQAGTKKLRSSNGGRIGVKANLGKKKTQPRNLLPGMQQEPSLFQNLWSSQELPDIGFCETSSMSPLPVSISSFPLETNNPIDTTHSSDTSSPPYALASTSLISTSPTLTTHISESPNSGEVGVDENSFRFVNVSVELQSKILPQQNFSVDEYPYHKNQNTVELDRSTQQSQVETCTTQSEIWDQHQDLPASIPSASSPSAPPPLEDPYSSSPWSLSSPPSSPLISPQRYLNLEFPSLPPEVDYLPLDLSGSDDWLESIFT